MGTKLQFSNLRADFANDTGLVAIEKNARYHNNSALAITAAVLDPSESKTDSEVSVTMINKLAIHAASSYQVTIRLELQAGLSNIGP